jgi:Lhr-like helicase
VAPRTDVLSIFQPAVAEWFRASFDAPTPPQTQGWPPIARGESTLILAPTGSGKTLTAFLWCLNRVMFDPVPAKGHRCRVLYISPLKALAVDIERNLRAPLAGIANRAIALGHRHHQPSVAIRTGDTPAIERARFLRDPADILITTPESLYLLLTSNAREALRSIDTVIIDEIHALVPTKRGAHLVLSLERLEELRRQPPAVAKTTVRQKVRLKVRHKVRLKPDATGPLTGPPTEPPTEPADDRPAGIQRIGLSATQRPLDEVARFLGGGVSRRAGRTRPRSKGLTVPFMTSSPRVTRGSPSIDP